MVNMEHNEGWILSSGKTMFKWEGEQSRKEKERKEKKKNMSQIRKYSDLLLFLYDLYLLNLIVKFLNTLDDDSDYRSRFSQHIYKAFFQ